MSGRILNPFPRLGQGREAAKRFLEENSDIYVTIENDVRDKLGMSKKDSENGQAGDKKETE